MFNTNSYKDLLKKDLKFKNPQEFKKYHAELYDYVSTTYMMPGMKFSQALYDYLYGKPVCQTCNSKNVKFITFSKGYRSYCSLSCSNKAEILRKKKSNTLLNKSEEEKILIIAKRKETLNSNYSKEELKTIRQISHKRRSQNNELKRRNSISLWWKNNDINEIKKKRIKKKLESFWIRLNKRIEGIVKPNFSLDTFIRVDSIYSWTCLKCNHTFSSDCDDGKIPKCPKCYPKTYSINEKEIVKWLQSLNINVEENVKIIKPKEVDIYLPDYKIAIEYCGVYWHSSTYKDKYYHVDKFLECDKLGIKLITIFDDEWIIKNHIVKNRLKSLLGLSEKIYARNCVIKKISGTLAKEFIIDHHLSGHAAAKYHYGLFLGESLKAVMTFGKSRYHKDNNCYELIRYCSEGNILGGASKLFKAFLEEHDPNIVISYADRKWGKGEVYKKLGFINVNPNNRGVGFDYIDENMNRKHRLTYKNKEKPEIKIYNCGNEKWIWNKEV